MLQQVKPPFAISGAGASASSGTVVFSNSNNVSFGQNGNTITATATFAGGAGFSGGVSTGGNTAGSTGVTGTRLVFVGTQNITLSQSTDANGGTISISGGAGAAGNTGFLSANATASLGTIVLSNSNNFTWGINGQTLTGSFAMLSAGVSTGGNTQGNTTVNTGSRFVLVGTNNITLSQATAAGATTISISGNAAQTTQPAINALGVSNTGNTAGNTGTSSGITWVVAGSNGITASQSTAGGGPNTIWISGAIQTVQTQGITGDQLSIGVSTGGNTQGNTTVNSGSRFVLVGTSNITLSQATAAGATTISISGNAPQTVQTQGITGDQLSIGVSTGGNTQGNTTVQTGNRFVLVGTNGITLSQATGAGSTTISISGNAAQTNQSAIKAFGVSNTGQTAGNTGVSTGIDWVMAGSGSITLSQSTVGGGPNTVWIQHPAWITTARASTDAIGLNTAQSNVTWTVNSSGLSLDARGYAGTGTTFNGANISGSITQNSAGLQLSMSVAAPGAAAENNWFTLTGAAAGNVVGNSSASGSTIALSAINLTLSGTNNSQIAISAPATSSLSATGWASISVNGSTISIGASTTANLYAVGNTFGTSSGTADIRTVSISAGTGLQIAASNSGWIIGEQVQSFFEPFPGEVNATSSLAPGSVSHCVAFNLPYPISASFIRIPASMNAAQAITLTTIASTANMSATLQTTYNAVVYSLGTGASSRSLISVASGSASWGILNSASVATNGTQASYTQSLVGVVEGSAFTSSTQYSSSTSVYSFFSTALFTNFSGARFLDIPFAQSLVAGPYWLIWGMSTSSNSNSARVSAATSNNCSYSHHYGGTVSNLAFGIMGSTNLTSGAMLGGGSFSTAGGGTTSILPISAISSGSSHFRPYFRMARSA